MIEPMRTHEDHNGDGLGIPQFSRRCTELTRDNFTVSGSDLTFTHVLQADTGAIRIAYIPSSTIAKLYGPAGTGLSRILPNVVDGTSTLDSRTIPLRVTGHDEDTTFEIIIWEY